MWSRAGTEVRTPRYNHDSSSSASRAAAAWRMVGVEGRGGRGARCRTGRRRLRGSGRRPWCCTRGVGRWCPQQGAVSRLTCRRPPWPAACPPSGRAPPGTRPGICTASSAGIWGAVLPTPAHTNALSCAGLWSSVASSEGLVNVGLGVEGGGGGGRGKISESCRVAGRRRLRMLAFLQGKERWLSCRYPS